MKKGYKEMDDKEKKSLRSSKKSKDMIKKGFQKTKQSDKEK